MLKRTATKPGATRDAQPQGLSRKAVRQLLSRALHSRSAGSRIDVISRDLLGHPYNNNPLIGSADTPEVFTASLEGFDCVTYIETVLAMAQAAGVDEFTGWLRKIRYAKGCVEWKRRNHYMTGWIRNNVRQGMLRTISVRSLAMVTRERVLNAVPGLAARRARIRCVPKRAFARMESHLQTGDLIFFVSTRRNLDVFHAGIVARDGQRVLMRHASRSRGAVVEQELREFLRTNRIAGVMTARPRENVRQTGPRTEGA